MNVWGYQLPAPKSMSVRLGNRDRHRATA